MKASALLERVSRPYFKLFACPKIEVTTLAGLFAFAIFMGWLLRRF